MCVCVFFILLIWPWLFAVGTWCLVLVLGGGGVFDMWAVVALFESPNGMGGGMNGA